MTRAQDVLLPDIGDFSEVEVIELLVQPGDRVSVDQSLITLESDKATMEIPSPLAGEVTSVAVAVGDKLSQGDLVLNLIPQDQPAEAEARNEVPEVVTETMPKAPEVSKTPAAAEETAPPSPCLLYTSPSPRD